MSKPAGALALSAAALAAWVAWGNTALTVSRVSVVSPRLPAPFSGFRIAQVSDLHNAQFGPQNRDLLALLRSLRPDLIALTGDLMDAYRPDLPVSLAFGAQAAAIAPTYFVPGNHEARLPQYPRLKAGLTSAGVTVLENQALCLERAGGTLRLAGVRDPAFRSASTAGDRPVMAAALASLLGDKGPYTVLLSHRPEFFPLYAAHGADLVLAGHTHGGQVRLPFAGGILAPGQGFFPRYDAGLFAQGATQMVVSRGLGNSLFPFRVNNRPEVVLAELRPPEP